MILPNGVTEASMRAALTEFSAIVGNEWFFGPENERLTAYNDAYPLDDLARSTQRPAFHSGHCTRGDCGANGWARFC